MCNQVIVVKHNFAMFTQNVNPFSTVSCGP